MNSKQGIYLLIAVVGITIGIRLFISGSVNRQHDGLYVINKSLMGLKSAWIVDGNEITVHPTLGVSSKMPCKQYDDRIEYDQGLIVYMNDQGNIVFNIGDFEMIRVLDGTNFTRKEVMTLLDTANSR